MSRPTATAIRMDQFTLLTRDRRLGIVVMLPHEENQVTEAEAEELAHALEEFTAAFRANIEKAKALLGRVPS